MILYSYGTDLWPLEYIESSDSIKFMQWIFIWTILSERMSDVKFWWGAWVCKQSRQLRKCIKKPINQSCVKKRSKLSTSSYQIYIESNRNQSSHSLPSNATQRITFESIFFCSRVSFCFFLHVVMQFLWKIIYGLARSLYQ